MTELAGTLRLARVAARRDRVTLPTWILGITAFQWAVINMSVTGLPTHVDLVKETQLIATTPALRMLGAPTGASIGGYAMVRGFLTIAILAGVMSLLTVVRHTRQNEELGRTELVAATGVGRYAALAAAVIVASLASLALAIGLAAVLTLAGQPALGSVTAGAAVGGVALSWSAWPRSPVSSPGRPGARSDGRPQCWGGRSPGTPWATSSETSAPMGSG